ncbi:hypothetical protein [Mesorhizobium sp. M0243]|uniref:glycosyltransferase n=1 Tax=Mesorhizobium sp. M0243 TaxID=2956925 RepID=UPI00333C1425
MTIVTLSCLALLLLLTIQALKRTRSAVDWVSRYSHTQLQHLPDLGSYPRLFVLLPALEEQAIVPATLDHFSRLTSPFLCIEIVVVTSNLENVRREQFATQISGPTTANLVDAWAAQNPAARVRRLHDPDFGGSKATKLAFATSVLLNTESKSDSSRIVFAVYDFDSRPSANTFTEYLARFNSEIPAPVVQQVPHPIGMEIDALRSPSLSRLFAIGHLERSLGLETHHYREVDAASVHTHRALRGCMGAGLFIRADTLMMAGNFPPDSDDIRLGYRLDLLGIKRETLASPNWVQPPPNIFALFKQLRRIYGGVYSSFTEVRLFLTANPHLRASTPFARAVRRHVQDAAIGGRTCLFGLLVATAYAGQPISIATALSFFAWGTQAFAFYLVVTQARKFSIRLNHPVQLRLSPCEWLLGPFVRGALQMIFPISYIGGRLWAREDIRTGIGKTPRLFAAAGQPFNATNRRNDGPE